MVQKLMNLAALLSLALVACTFGAQPATALAAHGPHGHLNRAEHHQLAVKKQRRSDASASKRCRKRPSSSVSLAHPTSSASFTSAKAIATSDAVSSDSSSSDAAPTTKVVSSSATKTPSSTSEAASTTQAKPTSSSEAPPPPPPATTHTSQHTTSTHTSTSSAAAPTNSPGGGATGPGKIGLAWPPGQTGLAPYINDNVKFLYSWRAEIVPEAFQYNLNLIPMLWGPGMEADFVAKAEKNVKGKYMAFLNEPNQSGQANINPQDAASLYWRAMKPMQDKGYTIIAPATSSAPDGLPWVQDFFKACGDQCHMPIIALHYYGTSADGFISYIEQWHTAFPDKQVMITEFACENYNTGYENNGQQCSNDQVWAFWSSAIKYMEAQDWIIAYFGFGVMRDMSGVNPDNQLMVPSTGKPTALGAKYLAQSW